MDIEIKVVVKAPLGQVSEYIEAYLKAEPPDGSFAKQLLEQVGIAFEAPRVTRVNSQKFTATAEVEGVSSSADYELAACPEGTEVTVTTKLDLDELMAAETAEALAEGEIEADELAEFKEFMDAMVDFAFEAMQPLLEASQQEWADYFPTFIIQQKALEARGPGGDLAA